jgi:hypothetical protein
MGHYLSDFEGSEPSDHIEPKKRDRNKQDEAILKILKETSLPSRLYVVNHMSILSFLVDNKFIPAGYWNDKKEKQYRKMIDKFAKYLTKLQTREMKQWEKDGKPK